MILGKWERIVILDYYDTKGEKYFMNSNHWLTPNLTDEDFIDWEMDNYVKAVK
jgi:hypothetical protein